MKKYGKAERKDVAADIQMADRLHQVVYKRLHDPSFCFDTVEQLYACAQQYFEWAEANPLWEYKVFHHQGSIVEHKVPKLRPFTLDGLISFLGITMRAWGTMRKDDGWADVCAKVEAVITEQKKSAAAADLMNAAFISKEIGIAETVRSELSTPDGPLQHEHSASDRLRDYIERVAERGRATG